MAGITSILTTINRLVEKGNTVMVIEHNLDVILNADDDLIESK
jgi:excinuclease UvrABC ATPase subunit